MRFILFVSAVLFTLVIARSWGGSIVEPVDGKDHFQVELEIVEGGTFANLEITNISEKKILLTPEQLGLSMVLENIFYIYDKESQSRYRSSVKFKPIQVESPAPSLAEEGYYTLPPGESVLAKFNLVDMYEIACNVNYRIFTWARAYDEEWTKVFVRESNEVELNLNERCYK